MKKKCIHIDREVNVYKLKYSVLMTDDIEEKEFENLIREIIDERLTYREREIIKLRFGFLDKKYTRKEIAKIFVVTIDKIRNVEIKALRKLKYYINEKIEHEKKMDICG